MIAFARQKTLVPLLIFLASFVIYAFATSNYKPLYSYHHNLYVAEALLSGRYDVANLPDHYHDVTVKDNKTYVPFGPAPAFVLAPFVAIFGANEFLPQIVGALLGATNIVLVFMLLGKLTTENLQLKTAKKITVAIFFGMGSVHLYAVFIGSTWFFAHIVGIFFLLIALNIILQLKSDNLQLKSALAGLALGLAVMSRAPLILSLPFFLWIIKKRKKTLATYYLLLATTFLAGFMLPMMFQLFYNYARFGTILQDGHALVYNNYQNFPIAQTIFRLWWPEFPLYNFLDIRNIPIHIVTAFFLMPKLVTSFPYLEFSPYGTSILITSPLWLLIVKAEWRSKINRASLATGLFVMFGVFLHFMQGWVQFSYRFSLDFAVFFLIPLASGIQRTNKYLVYTLLIISIGMNILGVLYGAR